ncbi:MAG: ribonuclease H-like domain-containing protein [Bacteroidia bacterium]|nr:ribonuclease H-like domain-containing protein [Bacteroidia bacterium]
MLSNINLESILFLDIETVPGYSSYNEVPERFRKLWDKKAEQLIRFDRSPVPEDRGPEQLFERAGIYAEFGKIICISTGIYRNGTLWIKSFYGDDEATILADFANQLSKAQEKKYLFLCAHNGKEFDYPYLIRRMLINGIAIPPILDLSGKKPWEVNHLDTMELWKFGDFKSYTSLELLAALFDIPTPKDDIAGSDVGRVYWQDHDLPRIVNYCQKDVVTTVNLLMKFKGKELIEDEKIQVV